MLQVREYVRDKVEASLETARRNVDAQEMAAMPRCVCGKIRLLPSSHMPHFLKLKRTLKHRNNGFDPSGWAPVMLNTLTGIAGLASQACRECFWTAR